MNYVTQRPDLLQLLTAAGGPTLPTGDVRYHGEYWGHSRPATDIGIPAR
jgi:hypothetical protein